MIASNDNWKTNRQTQIEAINIPLTDDSESVIVADLPLGLYTAVVGGQH